MYLFYVYINREIISRAIQISQEIRFLYMYGYIYVCMYVFYVYIYRKIISRAIQISQEIRFLYIYGYIYVCMYVFYVYIYRKIISRAIRSRARSDFYTYMNIYLEIRSRFSDLARCLKTLYIHEYIYVCMYVSMYIYRERSDLAHIYIYRERTDLEF